MPTPPRSARLVLAAATRRRLHDAAPAPATITARAQSTGRPSAAPSPPPLPAYKRVLGVALAPTTPAATTSAPPTAHSAATTTIAAASRRPSRSRLLAPPQPEPRWGIEPPHSPLPFPLLPGLPSAPRAASPRPPPLRLPCSTGREVEEGHFCAEPPPPFPFSLRTPSSLIILQRKPSLLFCSRISPSTL